MERTFPRKSFERQPFIGKVVFSLTMSHKLVFILFLIFTGFKTQAQQIYMPDANLRGYFNTNHPGSISGNILDNSYPSIAALQFLDLSNQNISDCTGLSEMLQLSGLILDNNPISTLSYPGSSLNFSYFSANNCGLTGTFWVANSLTDCFINNNNFATIDCSGGDNLVALHAANNQINTIIGNPFWFLGPNYVDLSNNLLTSIPSDFVLSQGAWLDVSNNQLTSLEFGSGVLHAENNQLTNFPTLFGSNSITSKVYLSDNLIDSVGHISGGVEELDLSNNPLTVGVANFDYGLKKLNVSSSQITCLPWLPYSVEEVRANSTPLSCLPNIPPSLDTAAAVIGFVSTVCASGTACYEAPPQAQVTVGLLGPWDVATNLMNDNLRQQGLIPMMEPYSALGYNYLNHADSVLLDPSLLAVSGPDAIVDWIVVEIRKGVGSNPPLSQSIPALVQRDGDVVTINGDSIISFNVDRGVYKIAIRHRNHLSIMQRFERAYNGNSTQDVDFLLGHAVTCYVGAIAYVNGHGVMIPGDSNFDHVVKYTGSNNDRDPILTAVGGSTPTNVVVGIYAGADINLDGNIKYTGSDNDRDIILQIVGGNTPTNTKQQVPGGAW